MPEDELVSVRGLVELKDFGTPLREFSGVLDSYYPEERKFGTFVVLNFTGAEIIRSVEPYNFPIATISIKLSNTKNSAWGIFSDSLVELLSEDQDIKDCVAKRMTLEMKEGHVYGQDREGNDMVGNPWRVTELEGAVAGVALTTAKDRAKELLIGKNRAEFNKAAYNDPIIRKDTALQRAITDKSFIKSLLQLGEVEEDENGVFKLPA